MQKVMAKLQELSPSSHEAALHMQSLQGTHVLSDVSNKTQENSVLLKIYLIWASSIYWPPTSCRTCWGFLSKSWQTTGGGGDEIQHISITNIREYCRQPKVALAALGEELPKEVAFEHLRTWNLCINDQPTHTHTRLQMCLQHRWRPIYIWWSI